MRSFVAGAVLAAFPFAAQAAPPQAAATSSGVYVWIDGSYRSVNLPVFSLGVHSTDASFSDLGPMQTFKPRVTGEGINGGIGFVLPDGVLPTAFGSNIRVGVTGNYVKADAQQTAFSVSPAPIQMWLDGSLFFGCGCGFSSSLVTTYSNWQLGLTAASDVRIGGVVWTPSIELIGGKSRARQTLTQTDSDETYVSSTNLTWKDLGLKFGLGLSVPVTPIMEIGLGGTLALVHRRAQLNGNDSLDDDLGPLLATAIDTSAHTFAVVPGAKLEFVYRPQAQTTIRLFGGFEWDSRVPGIVSPSFTPDQFFTFAGNPASIGFSGRTTYFAGGGFTYAFSR